MLDYKELYEQEKSKRAEMQRDFDSIISATKGALDALGLDPTNMDLGVVAGTAMQLLNPIKQKKMLKKLEPFKEVFPLILKYHNDQSKIGNKPS